VSSLTRRIIRNRLRKLEDYKPSPQPLTSLSDGGYKTLHPTKGWVKVSGKRVRAFGV
jgi:hypothetical protein